MPGCGSAAFLRQHADLVFDQSGLEVNNAVTLFDRARALAPPSPCPVDEDIPF